MKTATQILTDAIQFANAHGAQTLSKELQYVLDEFSKEVTGDINVKTGDKHEDILGENNSHPSFGVISISRVQCRPATRLFNSSIRHANYIKIEISNAHVSDHHGYNFIHAHGVPIVELALSPTQFSEAISGINQGSGLPCTISRIQGKKIPFVPLENEVEKHSIDFKDRMLLFADTIKEYRDKALSISKERLPKKQQDDFERNINMLFAEIESNIPFFAECFAEQMQKTTMEAKGEIEAFVQHRIISAGLQQLLGPEYSEKSGFKILD